MFPSKGLRWSAQQVGISRRKVEALPAKRYSSSSVQHRPIRGTSILPQSGALRIAQRAQFPKPDTLIRNATAVRYASWTSWPAARSTSAPVENSTPTLPLHTTPTTIPEASSSSAVSSATPPVAEPVLSAESATDLVTPLDAATTDFSTNSLGYMPDTIGYLQSLGIQYSRFRPTGAMEFVMEHIHVYSDTPWWATIALTSILIRIVFFKWFVNAAENNTRMAAIMPITKPITEKMTEASKNKDTNGVMMQRAELQRIYKRAGVKLYAGFLPALQFFPAMGTFFLLREMAALPVPALETGGLLWFQNLALADPYFLLPIGASTMLHLVLRKGGETGVSNMSPTVQKAMMWGLPGLSLAFTWWFPAAVQLSFFVTGFLSYCQVQLFAQPWFRRFFDMTPVAKKPVGPKSHTYQGIAKTSASPVLSQAEINSRFEGSGTPDSNPLRQVVGSVKGAYTEAADGFKGTVKAAQNKMSEQTEKAERNKVDAYEERRAKELVQERKEARRRVHEQKMAQKAANKRR